VKHAIENIENLFPFSLLGEISLKQLEESKRFIGT